nr:MAG TPA: hypothetical protein [Caudoviricetes sp.]
MQRQLVDPFFVAVINLLRCSDDSGNLRLCQIMILSQLAQNIPIGLHFASPPRSFGWGVLFHTSEIVY